jgi:hypothetical protein
LFTHFFKQIKFWIKRATPQATSPGLHILLQPAMVSTLTREGHLADVDHVTFANMEQHDRIQRVCPDWRKEEISSAGHEWLTNDVHPAFAEERFRTDGINHEETLLARRLASRLLEAECVMPFWWTMIFDDQVETTAEEEAMAAKIPVLDESKMKDPNITEEELRNGLKEAAKALVTSSKLRTPGEVTGVTRPPQFSEMSSQEALTADQIKKTKAALRDLGQTVMYGARPTTATKSMYCETAWFWKITDLPYPGSPAGVIINPQELERHSTAMKGDLISQAYASMSLGFQFVQQFAHAIIAATRSGPRCNWSNEYRFNGGDIMGADNCMLEACTFGGTFRKEQELASTPHYTIDCTTEGIPGLWFAFSDWANSHIEDMVGTFDVEDDEQYLEQESGPFYHREWQVPFSWFLRVLTDNFWDVHVREGGRPALVPPKEVGYVMSRDNDKKIGPYHSSEIRQGVVPPGWSMLPRSYVVVSNSLYHDAMGAIMFGGFSVGRVAGYSSGGEVGEGSEKAPVTEDTSIESRSDEDDDDASMEDDDDDASMEDVSD